MARHDYPGAIHLLHIQGRFGGAIFFPAELARDSRERLRECLSHVQHWESLLARTCDRYGMKIHGYSWLPNEAFLLLQRFSVPLRTFLPSWLGQYARHLHKTGIVAPGQSPYVSRYRSIEVTPEVLPYAVRHLYARAVSAGLCGHPSEYPFCSYSLHFADATPDWITTDEFSARVARRGYVGAGAVAQFLGKPESRRHAEIFGRLSSRRPHIAGEAPDIEDSMQLAELPSRAPSIEQVAAAVAEMLERDSQSSDRVLTAALTTWYATRSGAATLKQMGRWFGREPTTLRADIEARRKSSGALFELSVADLLRPAQPRVASTKTLEGETRDHGVGHLPGTPSAPVGRAGVLGPRRQARAATKSTLGSSSRPFRASSSYSSCMISQEDRTCPREVGTGEITEEPGHFRKRV